MAANATINTVWHGSFLFVLREEDIEVLIPDFNGHEYWAGPWEVGGLQPLVKGTTYKLCGARKEVRPPDLKIPRMIKIDGGLAYDYRTGVHSSWVLPYPKQDNIFVPVSVANEKKDFRATGVPQIDIPEDKLGVVYVLTFVLEDKSFSVDHLPLPATPFNLHIFAQEDHRMSLDMLDPHSKGAFDAMVSLTKAGDAVEKGSGKVEVDHRGEITLHDPVDLNQLPTDLRKSELVNLASSGLLNRRAVKADPQNLTKVSPFQYRVIDGGNYPLHPCPGGYLPCC